MATLNFDASQVEVKPSKFEALPAGDYPAMITASEMKSTKAGDGSYLSLTFELQGGGHQGRRVWTNLNLNNPNPTTVEIAQKQLAEICHAIGKPGVGESDELHNIPLVIKLSCKRDDYSGEFKNEVKGYKKLQATASTPAFKAPTAAAPTKPAAGGLPWAK